MGWMVGGGGFTTVFSNSGKDHSALSNSSALIGEGEI